MERHAVPSPAGRGTEFSRRELLLKAGTLGTFAIGTAAVGKPNKVRPLDDNITVTIGTPAPNSNVPGGGTFKTYGSYSPRFTGTTVTAQVNHTGTIYSGTPVTPIPHSPAYLWGFQFTGIPTGVVVTLTVQAQDTNGDIGSESEDITCVT